MAEDWLLAWHDMAWHGIHGIGGRGEFWSTTRAEVATCHVLLHVGLVMGIPAAGYTASQAWW